MRVGGGVVGAADFCSEVFEEALHDARTAVGHELGDLLVDNDRQALINVGEAAEKRPTDRPVIASGEFRQCVSAAFAVQLDDSDGAGGACGG